MMSKHHKKFGFRNPWLDRTTGISNANRLAWKFEALIKNPIIKPETYSIPFIDPGKISIPEHFNSTALTWVGHSTYLIQIDGVNILTDPVWSQLVGPYNKIGPRRKSKPGIPWDKLPRIDVVLISHVHYDHLDEPTIRSLAKDFNPIFLVPLGVKVLLEEWGVSSIYELDWWDDKKISEIGFVATPAQHTSRRGFFDVDRTLWCGWLINGFDETVFFAGDTGYFPEFSSIRRNNRRSPDVAILPIGAYKPRNFMRTIHMDPREALLAFRDLDARYFAAMHWGTFDVTNELLDEPPICLKKAADSLGINDDEIWLPALGETRVIPSIK